MDDPAQLHKKTVAMNEALILDSLRQHELIEAAERLNAQLRGEISAREQIFGLFGKDATLTGRTVIWRYAWRAIQEHPWAGYGPGGFLGQAWGNRVFTGSPSGSIYAVATTTGRAGPCKSMRCQAPIMATQRSAPSRVGKS